MGKEAEGRKEEEEDEERRRTLLPPHWGLFADSCVARWQLQVAEDRRRRALRRSVGSGARVGEVTAARVFR